MRRFAVLAALCLLASAALSSATARPIRLDNRSFASNSMSIRSGGFVTGSALDLSIGDTKISAGRTSGGLSSVAQSGTRRTPVIDESVLASCSMDGAVEIAGTNMCLSRDKLGGKLLLRAGQDIVDFDALESAGLLHFSDDPVSSVDEVNASGVAAGITTPVLADQAACSKAQPDVSTAGAQLPETGLITGGAAFSVCRFGATSSGFPRLDERSGVTTMQLTVNQALVGSLPQLQQSLGQVREALSVVPADLRAPVDAALDKVEQDVSSVPLLTIALGATESSLETTAASITARSSSPAVKIDVLSGLATIEVSAASAVAAATSQAGSADADAAIIRIRVLDLTGASDAVELAVTPDQLPTVGTLVPGVVEAADDGIVLLGGTPLSIHLSPGKASTCIDAHDAPCVLDGTRFSALAAASGVRMQAFQAPLPTVAAGLSQVSVGVNRSAVAAVGSGTIPVLARTGRPGQAPAAGLAVVVVAFVVRRRVRRA